MPNIRVDTTYTVKDGSEVVFAAPCNCSETDGLKVYYPDGSKEFTFKDAHGNALTGIGEAFAKGALVKVILDVTNSFAYIQNADTNSYIESTKATVPKSASGTMIDIKDSIAAPLHGLTLYGKTTQDGTPTPEAPVELVKAGASGSIVSTITDGTDSNVQTITAQTPNGLPGIPVESGGNYTDENGQQWICDEIDFARGVYVQRVREVDFATLTWKATSYKNDVQKGYYAKITGFYNSRNNFFHTHYRWLGYEAGSGSGANAVGASQAGFNARTIGEIGFCSKSDGQDNFGVVVGINDGTPVGTLQLVCVEPIETPLSAEELAQYAALHTNKPETTVYNDAGVDMEVSYFVSNAAVPMNYGQPHDSGKILAIDETGCVAKVVGKPSMVGIVASNVDITAGSTVDDDWDYYDVYK